MSTQTITCDVHTVDGVSIEDLIADVRAGLTKSPKELPPRWFYDDRGSELFEQITELPEYYPTRTETAILAAHANDIMARTRPESLVELGSGTSRKTRLLIEAGRRAGTLQSFVPFDVSESTVRDAAATLVRAYPGLAIHIVVGDFGAHVDLIPRFGRQLIAFLGSTIGNLTPDERIALLQSVRAILRPGDAFLLGADLVKDRNELIAAYDDVAGVTAEFNKNVLAVINRTLYANFELEAFEHVALWNEPEHRIEMHLRSTRRHTVQIPGAGLDIQFEAGELMRTELCTKFTRDILEADFRTANLDIAAWYTDPADRFAVVLGVPSGS